MRTAAPRGGCDAASRPGLGLCLGENEPPPHVPLWLGCALLTLPRQGWAFPARSPSRDQDLPWPRADSYPVRAGGSLFPKDLSGLLPISWLHGCPCWALQVAGGWRLIWRSTPSPTPQGGDHHPTVSPAAGLSPDVPNTAQPRISQRQALCPGRPGCLRVQLDPWRLWGKAGRGATTVPARSVLHQLYFDLKANLKLSQRYYYPSKR